MKVEIKTRVTLPAGVTLGTEVVGAAELELGAHAKVVALLVRAADGDNLLAIWWDRNRGGLVADEVS